MKDLIIASFSDGYVDYKGDKHMSSGGGYVCVALFSAALLYGSLIRPLLAG